MKKNVKSLKNKKIKDNSKFKLAEKFIKLFLNKIIQKLNDFFPKSALNINKGLQNNYIIIIILFISLLFYIINLDDFPKGFHREEAAVAYNAYCLQQTFRDENNNFLPVFIQTLNSYKYPVLTYLSIPFIKIIGLNEWSVRLLSSIMGILTILATYLFVIYTINKKTALIAVIFLIFSPWHFYLSRQMTDASGFSLFFLMTFFLFFLSFKKPWYLIPAIITFCLTIYINPYAKILLVFFYFAFFIIYQDNVTKNKIIYLICGIIFLLMISPYLLNSLKLGSDLNHNSGYSLFSNQARSITRDYLQKNNIITSNNKLDLLENQVFLTIYAFVKSYISHISPVNLLKSGDSNPRFTLPGSGVIQITEFIFFLIGLFFLIKKNKKFYKLLIAWLILSPLPACFYINNLSFSSISSAGAIPAIQITAAIGFMSAYKFAKYLIINNHNTKIKYITRLLILIFIILHFSETVSYLFTYFKDINKYDSSFENGYKKSMLYLEKTKKIKTFSFYRSDQNTYIFALFFQGILPKHWQNVKKAGKFINNPGLISLPGHAYLTKPGELSDLHILQEVFNSQYKIIYQIKSRERL